MIKKFLVCAFALLALAPFAAHADTDAYGWNPYQYGNSVDTYHPLTASPSFPEDEIGVRYWYSPSSLTATVGKPAVSRLDYSVDGTEIGETYFYLTSRNAKYLFKGVLGIGTGQTGNVDDKDYNTDGSLGQDASSNLSDGRLFYVYADLGYRLDSLSTQHARTSLLGGLEYIQDTMNGKGATCNQAGNGAFAADCVGGAGSVEAASGVKVIQDQAQFSALRVGLENNWEPNRRIAWHNEVVVVPYADFRNNDSRYLRTDLGYGEPNIVTNGNYAYGIQLETNFEYYVLPAWSVSVGARYWEFWVPDGSTKYGNPTQANLKSNDWDYQRYGFFVGTGYRF